MPTESERHLTLVIPGMFGPASRRQDAPKDLRMLELLLARSEPSAGAPRGLEATLLRLFGAVTEEGDLPVAALTRFLDMGVVDHDWWIRADPVHLHPGRDRLILSDNRMLDLTPQEANSLVAEIAQAYAADGWLIKAPRPDRWYLKPPHPPRISTTPLADAIGQDIHPLLPRGEDARAWHTILNEIQILLHTAVINTEREQQDKLPVNSVWFWGGGRLPRVTGCGWSAVWSREPVSLALARLCGSRSDDPPNDFRSWRDGTEQGAHLVLLDDALTAVQYGDVDAWAASMRRLESAWMGPIREALQTHAIASVALYSDTGEAFHLAARHVRRWWRRRRSLESFHRLAAGAAS